MAGAGDHVDRFHMTIGLKDKGNHHLATEPHFAGGAGKTEVFENFPAHRVEVIATAPTRTVLASGKAFLC